MISDYIMFQLIPEITSLTPITTALPLFGVLTLTAIKYAYDDVVSSEMSYVHHFKSVASFICQAEQNLCLCQGCTAEGVRPLLIYLSP